MWALPEQGWGSEHALTDLSWLSLTLGTCSCSAGNFSHKDTAQHAGQGTQSPSNDTPETPYEVHPYWEE